MSSADDLLEAELLEALLGKEVEYGPPTSFLRDRLRGAEEKERHRRAMAKRIEIEVNREVKKWADDRGLPAPIFEFVFEEKK